jgi:FkbM family methyltransferase
MFFIKEFKKLISRYRGLNKLISRYRGLNKLDKKIEKYIDFNNGFFVELGANDGITQSNTFYFEKHRGWRGVLIEPAPNKYLICKKNRSPKTKVYCNACTSFDYKEKFVEIVYSNLMSVSLNLETDLDIVRHIEIGKMHLDKSEDNFTFGAIARPLNEILIDANAPKKIDFLSLDVEGSEIEVLKGINYSTFNFSFICVEARNIDKIDYFLKNKGYLLIDQLSDKDYLFKKSS